VVESWTADPPRSVLVKGTPEPIVAAMRGRRLPRTRFVTLARLPDGSTEGWHNVRPDEAAAYRLAAEHLISHGHRRIGLAAGIEPGEAATPDSISIIHKVRGIRQAFANAELPDGLRVIYQSSQPGDDRKFGLEPANVARMVEWLKGADGPTAIIDRLQRLGSVRIAMRAAGLRLGEDVEIVGIGSPSPTEQAEFTCVSEDYEALARQVTQIIVSHDPDLEQHARHVIVSPRLIPRTQFDISDR